MFFQGCSQENVNNQRQETHSASVNPNILLLHQGLCAEAPNQELESLLHLPLLCCLSLVMDALRFRLKPE